MVTIPCLICLAVEQLINKGFGTHLQPLEFANQKEVDNSWAGKIGEVAGQAADFVAISVATGGVADAVIGVGISAMLPAAAPGRGIAYDGSSVQICHPDGSIETVTPKMTVNPYDVFVPKAEGD